MDNPSAIRVLIVDDNLDVCAMLERLLTLEGYIVVGKACDGLEAVELTLSTHPDVVLMDISMPNMDGIEATQHIQERCPTPIVVLSANETPELVKRISDAGAGAYLVKPAGIQELDRAIVIARARFKDMMALRLLNAELRTEISARMQAEASLQHRLDLEQVVAALSTDFINITSDKVDAAIDKALQSVGVTVAADHSYVFLFSEDGKKLIRTYEWSAAGGEPRVQSSRQFSVSDFPRLMERLARLESIDIPRVAALSAEAGEEIAALWGQDIESLMIVPLVYKRALSGFLGLASLRGAKVRPDEDIAQLRMVGEILVNALGRRQMERRLFQSEKLTFLGQMAGSIAHELRNPLGVISANAQLLQLQATADALAGECAQNIHTATLQASLIIERLLRFASPQHTNWAEVDLQAVLDESCALLAYQVGIQEVSLQWEPFPVDLYPGRGDLLGSQRNVPRVYGDAGLLQHAFTDLILNACRYISPGGSLTVRPRLTAERPDISFEAPRLMDQTDSLPGVEIRFTGSLGDIPQEQVVGSPLSRSTIGFGSEIPGLEFSVGPSIIEQHQGVIVVDTQMDEGFAYIVWLPICT